MKRWVDKTAKRLSKCWELTAKSLKEGWFTSIFRRDGYFVKDFLNLRNSGRKRDRRRRWYKRAKNMTLKERWSKLSWHPHHAIYPSELRDWSLLSWHPHYAICLLRWWVSEWESTRMKWERLLGLCSGQNRERCGRDSEVEWENERIRGRPKADHRTQWNQGCDELTNYLRVIANAENWMLNQISWQRENDCSIPLDNSSRIAILWRNSSILNHDESATARLNVWTKQQREFIRIWRQIKEIRQKRDSCRTRNQDFVAPAPYHIPLWAAGLLTSFVAPAFRENAFWNCVLDSSR